MHLLRVRFLPTDLSALIPSPYPNFAVYSSSKRDFPHSRNRSIQPLDRQWFTGFSLLTLLRLLPHATARQPFTKPNLLIMSITPFPMNATKVPDWDRRLLQH